MKRRMRKPIMLIVIAIAALFVVSQVRPGTGRSQTVPDINKQAWEVEVKIHDLKNRLAAATNPRDIDKINKEIARLQTQLDNLNKQAKEVINRNMRSTVRPKS